MIENVKLLKLKSMKNNEKNPAMTDSVMSESPLLGPTLFRVGCDEERFISPEESRLRAFGMGEASGCGPRPIKDREQFFELLEEGLQQYFDQCDRYWGGILHLTVGVKVGKVGGIIKSADAFGASVATTEGLSSQRSLPPPRLSYEGFTLHRVETILKYVLPRFVSRDSVPYAIAAVLDELRTHADEPTEPAEEPAEEQPKPKKHRTRGRKKKTEVEPVNTETHEQEETEQQAQ